MEKLTSEQLGRLTVEDFKKTSKIPLSLILDNVRSLNNIGSIFRSADAFLIEKIYLCGITACPPHKEIHKTALGATESVCWEYVKDIFELLERLQQTHTEIIALEQVTGATLLQDFFPEKEKQYALILGNEVDGVQQEVVSLCHKAIEIPQFGTKHSLNIAVSAGIALWDISAKLRSL